PRCALLPAPTPRVRAVRAQCIVHADMRGPKLIALLHRSPLRNLDRCEPGEAPSCGGWGREGVRSEARAQQRLAPGGRAALPLTRNECVASYLSRGLPQV